VSNDLGTAQGSVVINAAQALATLAALRRSSAATVGTLNTVGRAAITAGTGFAAVGAGIAGVFAIAISKSAEIEKKISYISGITGIHGKEVDVVREKIIQLGQDSAYTASEVADGFTELSKAGATTEQLVGGVGDAMITLGQSADIGLADAAKALISIQSTFGLAAKDAAHIADVLQGAANSSIIEVSDMAVSMKYAGGVAANLGISLEDTATAIALLGNAGIKGSTAGTSLRRIMLQLTPRTDKAAAAMKQLGIITKDGSNRFYDAEGKAKSFSEITEILRTSTAGLTAEMKQKALATIFGDRAINSAIALSKGGSAAFDAMYKKIGNVKAADVAAKRLDNLAGSWEILKGTIDSALIRAGAPAQKPLQQIVQLVTQLINAFNKLSPASQSMIVRFGLIAAALLLMTGGFLMIAGTVLRAMAVIQQLANVYKILRMQMMLFIAVQRAANGAMLFNPITLIIVAIIALVAAFIYAYKHSETFRKAVDKIAASFMHFVSQVWNFLKAIPGAVSNAWNATKNFFVNMYNAVANFISSAIDFIKSHWAAILLVLITGPLGIIIVLIMAFKDKIIGFFAALATSVINWVTQMGSRIISAVVGFATAVPGHVAAMVTAVLTWFAQLPARIGFLLGFIIGFIIRFYIQMYTWLVQGTIRVVTAVVSFFMQLPGRIWAALVAALTAVNNFATAVVQRGLAAGRNFLNAVVSFFRLLPGRVASFVTATIARINAFVAQAGARGLAAGRNFLNNVVNFIRALPGRVYGFLAQTLGRMSTFVSNAASRARAMASQVVSAISSGLGRLPGIVSGALGNAIAAFKHMVGAAFSAAKSFANGLWTGFKKGLGISSPSFIERAMTDITDHTGRETKNLKGQVRSLQKTAAGIPGIDTSFGTANLPPVSVPNQGRYSSMGDASVSAAPLIGVQYVYNPVEKPASQTAAEQAGELTEIGPRSW
jgi:TP901 family phage tail tape measure protein